MNNILEFIAAYIFYFPLLMSVIWIVGALVFYWTKERGEKELPTLDSYPQFSILVPAHNEKEQIQETIEHLLTLNYPDYEIIVADDGSIDGTSDLLHELSKKYSNLRVVYMRENGGKGAALNAACALSNGRYILCIDADALLDRDALIRMAWHFNNFPRVGAVTGNPRVLNRTTLLAKIQTGEFATIIGLIKRAQRVLGKVLTVSGVIAAFRKEAITTIGLWDPNMATDDIDITWKLEKNFWDVRYEPHAIIWVLVPETLKGLWNQRLRWSVGGVEVLKKNGDVWKDWRQRRFWPVYVEYIMSVFWAYCFWLGLAIWSLQSVFDIPQSVIFPAPLPPNWDGAILAMTCIVMFFTSLMIDHAYEKGMIRYLFWVIWYPVAYWFISAATVVVAFTKVMLRKKGELGQGVWTSPDRGIHFKAQADHDRY